MIMARPAIIPAGSGPRRMGASLAAGYVGEVSVEAFLKRVGQEYPKPRVVEGPNRRQEPTQSPTEGGGGDLQRLVTTSRNRARYTQSEIGHVESAPESSGGQT